MGFCIPFVFSWCPWPIRFPWASLTLFLTLHFHGLFTNFFGLPQPNYLILHPWGSWACHQPLAFFACITLGLLWPILTFPHHILPMCLLFLSFRASLSPFASSRPICLFHGPVIHYSYRLGLMVFFFFFFYPFTNSFIPVLLGFFLFGFPKTTVNTFSSLLSLHIVWRACPRTINTLTSSILFAMLARKYKI